MVYVLVFGKISFILSLYSDKSMATVTFPLSALVNKISAYQFTSPTKNNGKTMIDFIKCIEKNLFKEVEVIGNNIRNQSIPIIKRIYNRPNNFSHNDKLLLKWLKCTKKFMNVT